MQGRIKDFFSRDRKTLYIILSIVLISIFSLTIVYAALSVTLNIQGNAQVVASTWDIHLDNVKVTNGSVSGTTPSITSPTTATFSTTLNMPGEFYEFTIDVVNDGSIDAMIDSVTKEPTLTETQAKYLNYIVEYQNGESINTKQLVAKNSFVRLKVRVEFRKDITASDLPTTSETLNLAFSVNYIQSDGTENNITNNGVKVVIANGDINTIGTIVTIGNEQFYIIGSEGENIKLLSLMSITLDENPIQSVSAQGSIFATTMYWTHDYNNPYQYVYNNNSVLYNYVENYKKHLESLGAKIEEARLIKLEELEELGCVIEDAYSYNSCNKAPEWVYSSTGYWTGNAGLSAIWYVYKNSSNGILYGDGGYKDSYKKTIRPVIVISKIYF